MKKLFLFFVVAVVVLAGEASAQGSYCGIFFEYDAVGNRTKRSYDCKPVVDVTYPPNPTSKLAPPGRNNNSLEEAQNSVVVVYPNPTSGAFTIKLSGPPEEPVHFHWYKEQLHILGSGNISGVMHSGDISGWADGVYILRVYEGQEVHAFKIVKVSAVGR